MVVNSGLPDYVCTLSFGCGPTYILCRRHYDVLIEFSDLYNNDLPYMAHWYLVITVYLI